MDQRSTIIRSLKGAPWTVMVALLLFPDRSLGVGEIERATGYSDKTIKRALEALSDHGLAQRHGRYRGWTATTRFRQVVLGELPSEPETFRLPDGGSSSQYKETELPPIITTTTTTTPEPEILRLPPDWEALVDLLVERCAAPPARARAALQQAMDRNEYPGYVRFSILRWLSYCTSEDGQGINNVGAFITTRISGGVRCPDWHRVEDCWGDLAREIKQASQEWDQEARNDDHNDR